MALGLGLKGWQFFAITSSSELSQHVGGSLWPITSLYRSFPWSFHTLSVYIWTISWLTFGWWGGAHKPSWGGILLLVIGMVSTTQIHLLCFSLKEKTHSRTKKLFNLPKHMQQRCTKASVSHPKQIVSDQMYWRLLGKMYIIVIRQADRSHMDRSMDHIQKDNNTCVFYRPAPHLSSFLSLSWAGI